MKRRLKSLVASTLAVAMVLSSAAVVSAQNPSSLVGTGTIQQPIISVTLPAAPVITINPFGVGGATAPEISSPVYIVANRSNVPVDVTMRVGPREQPATDRAFFAVDAEAFGAIDDDSRTVLLNIEWFTNVTDEGNRLINSANAAAMVSGPTGTGANVVPGVIWNFAEGAAGARSPVSTPIVTAGAAAAMTATGGELFHLRLGAANYTLGGTGTLIGTQVHANTEANRLLGGGNAVTDSTLHHMNQNQFVAFRFGGELNPDAPNWAPNTVAAQVVFHIRALTPAGVLADIGTDPGDLEAVNNTYNVYTVVQP